MSRRIFCAIMSASGQKHGLIRACPHASREDTYMTRSASFRVEHSMDIAVPLPCARTFHTPKNGHRQPAEGASLARLADGRLRFRGGLPRREPLKIRASGTRRVFFRHISQNFLPWGKPRPRNFVSSDKKILRRLLGAEYLEVPLSYHIWGNGGTWGLCPKPRQPFLKAEPGKQSRTQLAEFTKNAASVILSAPACRRLSRKVVVAPTPVPLRKEMAYDG